MWGIIGVNKAFVGEKVVMPDLYMTWEDACEVLDYLVKTDKDYTYMICAKEDWVEMNKVLDNYCGIVL